MSEKKNPLGPSGEMVCENVKRLRAGMTYKELAEKLAAVGRPIPTLGLRRIEAGTRRVDADDLVALAVVFDVSPLTLLLPSDGMRALSSPMTGVPDRDVSHNTQWLWGLGQEPLELPGLGRGADSQAQIAKYRFRAKPDVEPRSAAVGGFVSADEDEAADQENDMIAEAFRLAKTQGIGGEDGDD